MLREILHQSITPRGDSKKIKVFLFPKDTKKKHKAPEADGKVSFNMAKLEPHKNLFKEYVERNDITGNQEYSWERFTVDIDTVWATTKDDALILMAALEVLGFGTVTGNTEKEEKIIKNGFIQFPMFKASK